MGRKAVMPGVPMFVEVAETREKADTRVCCKVADLLLSRQVGPVGLAGTVEEVQRIMEEMKQHGLSPAIFVINTFGAKSILHVLDPLIGKLPILYLRRRLFAGRSGLLARAEIAKSDSRRTMAVLEGRATRLTAMWYYGGRNCDEIAKRVATAVFRFLEDGDFLHIERACIAEISGRNVES